MHEPLLRPWLASEVDTLQGLLVGQGQDGGARLEGVGELAHEVEPARLTVLMLLGLIVVAGDDEPFVAFVAEVVVLLGVSLVAAGDDLAHEAHRRIVPAPVMFPAGADDYLLRRDAAGRQAYVQTVHTAAAYLDQLRIIPQVRHLQRVARRGGGQREAAFVVGAGADGRAPEHQGHVGQAFARLCVRHRALHRGLLGKRRQGHQTK